MAASPTHRDTFREVARVLRRDRAARRTHRRKPEVEARRWELTKVRATVFAASVTVVVQVLPKLL